MIHQVRHLYDGCCSPVNAAEEPDEIPQELEDLLQRIHAGKLKAGAIDLATAGSTAERLMEAVFEGFGGGFDTIAYGSPDYALLRNLETNVYQFSAAKNYQMLKDLTLSLKDGDQVRSFPEFRREAAQKLDTWVGSWLQTEYDTAIGSAQMASRWQEYQQYADVLPMATYRTVGDSRVRAEHAALDGVTRPLSDPFWNKYWPPNGFNCRCDVEQTTYNATPIERIVMPDVPTMFQVNLGKEQLVFPPDHPYYDGVPKKVLNSLKPPKRDA